MMHVLPLYIDLRNLNLVLQLSNHPLNGTYNHKTHDSRLTTDEKNERSKLNTDY